METERPRAGGLGLWRMMPKLGGFGASCKAPQAHLGEENTMYFNTELGRWVERGKESEAQNGERLAPPPMVQSCPQARPASRRSLTQRYVLQNNLSVAPTADSSSLLPCPLAPVASSCSIFEPPTLPSRLLLPAGAVQEQELPSSGPPSSGSDCSPFFGSRSTTRSSSSSSLSGTDSRTNSCDGAHSMNGLADGLAGSFDLLRSTYGPMEEDDSPREQVPINFAAVGHAPVHPTHEPRVEVCPPPQVPCGGQTPDMQCDTAPSTPDDEQVVEPMAAERGAIDHGLADVDGGSDAASLNRILSLSLSFAQSEGSAPSSPSGAVPGTAPESPKVIRSHAISCSEDTSPYRGQSFTFACAVPSNFTFDVPAAAVESAQLPAPSLVLSPAPHFQQQAAHSQPLQQLEQELRQLQPASERPAVAAPPSSNIRVPAAAGTGSAVDEVLLKLKQLRGALLEAAPARSESSVDSADLSSAAAPQLNQTVAEAARALAGLGVLPSPFAAASAAAAAPIGSSSCCSSPPSTEAPNGPVKVLATPAIPPPRRRCVASPDSLSGPAQQPAQGHQQVPAGYVSLVLFEHERAERAALATQLEHERAERAALATQLEHERAERAALATQLEQERAERAALATQLEQERAERAALATQLEQERAERAAMEEQLQTVRAEREALRLGLKQEANQRLMLASQLGKEAAERASLALQLEQERAMFAVRLQEERVQHTAHVNELGLLREQCARVSQATAAPLQVYESMAAVASDAEEQQRQDMEGSDEDEEDERDMLMLCLGEQSRKVEVLVAALMAAGVDPAPLLVSVEEAATAP